MPRTRAFRETVVEAAQRDPEYRRSLLTRGIGFMLGSRPEDIALGKGLVRDYIDAAIGFKELGVKLGEPPKSLMRMFGPMGNPRLDRLSRVLAMLQEHEGVHLIVQAEK